MIQQAVQGAPAPNYDTEEVKTWKTAVVTMGIIQIIIGVVCIAVQIGGIVEDVHVSEVGTGIWAGGLFVLVGCLSIPYAINKNTAIGTAALTFTIVAMCVSLIMLIIVSVGLSQDRDTYDWIFNLYDRRPAAYNTLLLIGSILEGILTIIHVVFLARKPWNPRNITTVITTNTTTPNTVVMGGGGIISPGGVVVHSTPVGFGTSGMVIPGVHLQTQYAQQTVVGQQPIQYIQQPPQYQQQPAQFNQQQPAQFNQQQPVQFNQQQPAQFNQQQPTQFSQQQPHYQPIITSPTSPPEYETIEQYDNKAFK